MNESMGDLITVVKNGFRTSFEDGVLHAVQDVGIYVNKEELEKAIAHYRARRVGHWVPDRSMSDLYFSYYKCSVCGRRIEVYHGQDIYKEFPFCHCGACMEEGL